MDMGQKIYELRTQKGMTLEELGNKVGVGKSTVRKWENGIIANMKRDKISKVATALDTTPAYLMGWAEESEAQPSNVHNIHPHEKKLLKSFSRLTDINKEKVITYSEGVLQIQEADEEQERLKPQAAHERTDIEVTDEMRKHDDDLMKNTKWK